MKSKLLLLSLLTTAACLAFTGCEGPGGEEEDVFKGNDGSCTWRLENGILTIRGEMRDYDGGSDSAPWIEHWHYIEQVVVAEGVTNIGSYAFYNCINLTKISIPASVAQVGEHAFARCPGLTAFEVAAGNPVFSSSGGALLADFSDGGATLVAHPTAKGNYTIPAGVRHIADRAYALSEELTRLTIPGSVESIGAGAFSNCHSLESITIANGVKSIGQGAFNTGSSLITSLVVPDSVESIGPGAFSGCYELQSLSIPGIELGGYSLGFLPITELTISSGVLTSGGMPTSYFKDCTELKTVTLGEGMTELRFYAFAYCTALETISIPASMTTIDAPGVFEYCIALKRIDVAAANSAYKSVDGVLLDKAGTTLLVYPYGNTRENYTIPAGVTTLPSDVLNGLPLRTLTIPASVTDIGFNVFCNWQYMTDVYIHATTPPEMGMQHYFDNFGITPMLHVPAGCRAVYEQTYPWSLYFDGRISEQ